MKIGILTFYFAENYGAVVQAWALSTYLKNCGHEVVFVDYNPQKSKYPWWLVSLRSSWRSFCRKRRFRQFVRKYLYVSPETCDAYIVGSDQVWNIDYFRDARGEFDDHYFLGFVPEGGRRIAYAASIGEGRWERDRKRLKTYLSAFNAISVREPFARDVLVETGFPNTCVVPDPTALLRRENYFRLIGGGKKKSKRRAIFVYVLTEMKKCKSILRKLMETYPDAVVNVVTLRNDRTLLFDARIKGDDLSPIEWIRSLSNADVVLTDSFHGTMLSLIFNREFFVMMKTGEPHGNDRMLSILKIVGLERQVVESPCDAVSKKIDWEKVNERLAEYREVGIKFLQESLRI